MANPALLPRRRLLGGVASLLAAGGLAGCTGDDGGGGNENGGTDTETASDGGESENGDDEENNETDDGGNGDEATETPGTDELDRREANVVGVTVESQGENSYRFDVTLHHDDDGEEGYANWWQVERLEGTQLGRRELLHAHSRQPFTRSETIDVPADVSCVVVRGHDQTHDYGGAAMVVDVASGAANTVSQGSERQSIDESACP